MRRVQMMVIEQLKGKERYAAGGLGVRYSHD